MVFNSILLMYLMIGVLFILVVDIVLLFFCFLFLVFMFFRLVLFRLFMVVFWDLRYLLMVFWSLVLLIRMVLVLRLVLNLILFSVWMLVGFEMVMNRWLFFLYRGRVLCLWISFLLMVFFGIMFGRKVFRLSIDILNFIVVENVRLLLFVRLFCIRQVIRGIWFCEV